MTCYKTYTYCFYVNVNSNNSSQIYIKDNFYFNKNNFIEEIKSTVINQYWNMQAVLSISNTISEYC